MTNLCLAYIHLPNSIILWGFHFDFIDLALTSSAHTRLLLLCWHSGFSLSPWTSSPSKCPHTTSNIEMNAGQTWSCLLIFAINIYIKARESRTLFCSLLAAFGSMIHLITLSTSSVWYDDGAVDSTTFPMLQVNVDGWDKRMKERQ